MTSAPQTTGNSLINELNQACEKTHFSQFEIARLNKKANDLVKVDPVEGYTALGAIAACFDFNINEMKAYHQKALRISANDFFAMSNYVASLGRTWLLSEQFDLLQDNISTHPHFAMSTCALNRAILGLYNEAYSYGKEFLALPNADSDADVYEITKTFMQVFDFLNAAEVDSTDVKRYSKVMNDILNAHQISLGYLSHSYTPEGELIRNLAVDKSDEIVSKLNDELIEQLIEKEFSNNFISHVSGRFIRCE